LLPVPDCVAVSPKTTVRNLTELLIACRYRHWLAA
jgi:hypothetical protein